MMDAQEATGGPMSTKEAEQWLENEGFYDTGITKRVGQVTESYSFSSVLAAHSAQVEAERDKWRIAMENLTPGGSEFHKDLDRCVTYVRERFDMEHKWVLKAVADKKAVESELVKLREALRWIPVQEKLPEQGKEVLAGGFITAKFRDGTENTAFVMTIMQYIRGKWYDEDGNEDGATHWKPLPDPLELGEALGETGPTNEEKSE
jgi:hypothetical protein